MSASPLRTKDRISGTTTSSPPPSTGLPSVLATPVRRSSERPASQWLAEVNAQRPSVVLGVRDAEGHDLIRVKVSVDGVLVASALDGSPLRVDPGQHVFRFEAEGFVPQEQTVLARQGEANREITVVLASASPPSGDVTLVPGGAPSVALAGKDVAQKRDDSRSRLADVEHHRLGPRWRRYPRPRDRRRLRRARRRRQQRRRLQRAEAMLARSLERRSNGRRRRGHRPHRRRRSLGQRSDARPAHAEKKPGAPRRREPDPHRRAGEGRSRAGSTLVKRAAYRVVPPALVLALAPVASLGCQSILGLGSETNLPETGPSEAGPSDGDAAKDAHRDTRQPSNAARVVAASGGGSDWCVVTENGDVECWGNNESGELGNGTTEDRWTPVKVLGLPPASYVSIGDATACALTREGAVYCWGLGEDDALGTGTNLPLSKTAVPVSGLEEGVTAISCGYGASCAVKNGGVLCWGYGGNGLLGRAQTADSPVPAPATGLESGVTSVSVGGNSRLRREGGSRAVLGRLRRLRRARERHNEPEQHRDPGDGVVERGRRGFGRARLRLRPDGSRRSPLLGRRHARSPRQRSARADAQSRSSRRACERSLGRVCGSDVDQRHLERRQRRRLGLCRRR